MEAIRVLGDFGKRRIPVHTVMRTREKDRGVVEEAEWIYLLL